MKPLVIKHGKKKKKYEIAYTVTAEEQLLYTEKIHAEIKAWLEIEREYAISSEQNSWLNTLSRFDPKAMAYNDHHDSDILRQALLEQFPGTISRLIDLDLELHMAIPTRVINAIKGRIYQALLEYESLDFPTREEWSELILTYPFLWLVFLCKNRLSTTQLATKA